MTKNLFEKFNINNCDMKNIIFETNKYANTFIKFSNLFKSKFIKENLKNLNLEKCNTFLCTLENSCGFEINDIDKYSIIK